MLKLTVKITTDGVIKILDCPSGEMGVLDCSKETEGEKKLPRVGVGVGEAGLILPTERQGKLEGDQLMRGRQKGWEV